MTDLETQLTKIKENKKISNKKYYNKVKISKSETELETKQEIKSVPIINKEECPKEIIVKTEPENDWIWNITMSIGTTIGQTMLQIIGMAAIPILMKMFIPTPKTILSAPPLKQEEIQSTRVINSLDSL